MVQAYAAASGYDVPALSVENLRRWGYYFGAVESSMQGFAQAGLSALAEAIRLGSSSARFDYLQVEPLVADHQNPYHWSVNPDLARRAKPTASTRAENPEWNCPDHGDLVEASGALMASAMAVTATLSVLGEPEHARTTTEGETKVESVVYGFGLAKPELRHWAGQQLGENGVATLSLRLQRDFGTPDGADPDTEPSWQPRHTISYAAALAASERRTLFGSLRAMTVGSEVYIHGSTGVCEGADRFGYAQDHPFRIITGLAAIVRRLCSEYVIAP